MEVRCGNCNKLFRVSDDKISGKGVKFTCTRCGKYVKIAIEEFLNYTRSKTSGSELDQLDQELKTASEHGQLTLQTADVVKTSQSTTPEKADIEPAPQTTIGQELLNGDVPNFLQEREEQTTLDRFPFEMPDYKAGTLPERGLEFPVQTESQIEKSDITQSHAEEMSESQMEADTAAMQAEMSESVTGRTPVSAIRADVPPVSEPHSGQSTEAQTTPFQAVTADSEPGIGTAGIVINEVQSADEQRSQSQLESKVTKFEEQVDEFEAKPAMETTIGKSGTAQSEPKQPVETQQEAITEKTEKPARVTEQEPEVKHEVIPPAVVHTETQPEIEVSEAGHESAQNIPGPQTMSQPMSRSKPVVFSNAQTVTKEHPSPASAPVIGASPGESLKSGSRSMIVVALLIILILAGLGVYMFMRTTESSSNKTTTAHLVSTEGLHILNAAGSFEPNTDLIISGVVENLTDKPQPAWLVVVNFYDTKGAEINIIKLLNGKQLYSQRDYDILAKRGANVRELKAKAIQGDGTVILPHDKVTFEIRYLEPPVGIASFNATLEPFDPSKLTKEVEEQSK
jgi:predicted Zn finger-like uncharacterized protein